MLLHHGVKPEGSDIVVPTFVEIFRPLRDLQHQIRQLDILRLMLVHETGLFEDFANSSGLFHRPDLSLDLIEWLWYNVTRELQHEDVIKFRSHLLEFIVLKCSLPEHCVDHERIIECTANWLYVYMKEHYQCGKFSLMDPLFIDTVLSIESGETSSRFIELLFRWGIDIQACIESELICVHDWHGPRKIIFEPDDRGSWLLRWKWWLDSHSLGYLLASEYLALGPDAVWLKEPPFGQGEHEPPFMRAEIDA